MGTGASAAANTELLNKATEKDIVEAVKSLPAADLEKVKAALACVEVPLGLRLMTSAHNTRAFDPKKAVPRKVICDILEAIRNLPTSANTQPWTVVVTQGATRDSLAKKMLEKFDAGDDGEAVYPILPTTMTDRMQKAVGSHQEEFEKFLGVEKGDKDGFRAKLRPDLEFGGAPLHLVLCAPEGPCIKEDPIVDGVFLDMGSLMTAIGLCAHDHGLGVHASMRYSRHSSVYREVLAEKFPADHIVVCGMSIGWPENGRDPRKQQDFMSSRLSVDDTTRWLNCDSSWLSAAPARGAGGMHGLHHLVQSRHCSHSLDTSKAVPKDMLASILAAARYVQSAMNSQPWQITVIQGEARDKLSKAMLEHFDAGNDGKQTYKKYSQQNTERMQKGKDMYGTELYEQRHGLERGDTAGRRLKYRPNYEFWGAPVLLLLNLPKSACAGTFVDVGSYMMAILLGMHAYGLGGKPLGSVAKYTDICRQVLGEGAMPENEHLVCGMCIGWPKDGRDPRETPDWFPSRLPMDETTVWVCDEEWSKE